MKRAKAKAQPKLDQGLYQIMAESQEYKEREQMANASLDKEASEAMLLAVAARLHLWARLTRRFQNN